VSAQLGLGTVQFGLDYGVSNPGGTVSAAAVSVILTEAPALGVEVLDTAPLYGASEEVLGAHDLGPFRVVTKTPRFGGSEIGPDQVREVVRAFRQSLQRLRRPAVYGLIVHLAEDLLCPGGEHIMAAMAELKGEGLVSRIGCSVYDGKEIDALLDRYDFDLIQLPVNVLDQRLVRGGHLRRLKDRGVEVHARSVFLQGLLLMEPESVPAWFEPVKPLLRRWRDAVESGGSDPVRAALAFVRDLPGIDVAVIGVNDPEQFRRCARDFTLAPSFDAGGLACDDPRFVNPALWRLQ
jgi:aryl-alcohol dehydrogenase-like predicted oxidoreductase